MKSRAMLFAALAALLTMVSCSTLPPGQRELAALVSELDRIAVREVWPGFDPRAHPFALYDGNSTWLVRHPAPPEEFASVAGAPGVRRYEGRHPSITANSSVEIGGVVTATIMMIEPSTPLRDRTSLLLHELFHSHQRQKLPTWVANEVDFFLYPFEDEENLALQWLELEALSRALRSGRTSECWARRALEVRSRRFARIGEAAAEYERRTELNEGMATWVQHRVTFLTDGDVLSQADEQWRSPRARGYASGHALARLLERFVPDWQQKLVAEDVAPDVLLARTIGLATPPQCPFSPAEEATARELAAARAAQVVERRAARRSWFHQQPGTMVVANFENAVLFPQQFDPLNVEIVSPGEVLHSRMVTMGNGPDSIEVIGRAVLTEAAGPHPLFNGVKRVSIGGFAEMLQLEESDGTVTVRGEGMTLRLRNARVGRSDDRIEITVGAR